MRRKSERTASKKGKASPEKKVEKVKRTRTSRRRKQSSSSENESPDEPSPVREVESVVEPEKKPPTTPAKEENSEEALDQVWRVKTTETPGDIKKLKICLTRPPSTPERVDRSPRSKRKHSRATSSSDTPSVEGADEKKKTKHRSKRAPRGDSKDGTEKSLDSQGEEPDHESGSQHDQDKSSDEVTQSETVEQTETPVSTTNEDMKVNESENLIQSSQDTSQEAPESKVCKKTESQDTDKVSDADTTVASPKDETRVASPPEEQNIESNSDNQEVQLSNITETKSPEPTEASDKDSPKQTRSQSVEKSEVLELHAEDSKCESDNETGQTKVESKEESKNDTKKGTKQDTKEDTKQETKASEEAKEVTQEDSKDDSKEEPTMPQEEKKALEEQEVSKNEETISKETDKDESEVKKPTNKTDVVESSEKVVIQTNEPKMSTDSGRRPVETAKEKSDEGPDQTKELQRSDSVKSAKEEPVANGQAAPVVGRKRRWGSRSSKLTTQRSITISTDILKDIIPDVKPVEFDEVIEEKKHKRAEHQERIERPVLPKIIIDNTDNVELKKEPEDNDKDHHAPKPRDLASNRKISIIKDNDSIITRPPSPPRNKQSCILYITNLVRPFTLPQLKNLLQRTGRIIENGFWIDRIKSKCFVQYETEDQAVETRHALHGVTWPVSNPKTLQVDFSTQDAFDKAKLNEETDTTPVSTIPGTVEDWLREQDMKRERGELEKPWERKAVTREWDLGKNDKDKDNKDIVKIRRDERPMDKRRHRSPEKSPEPARKFKKKEEEAPAKLLDDLFRKTKTTPCIYWLPLSAETIAIKEEQRRQHMAEHERRLQELRRTHRRH